MFILFYMSMLFDTNVNRPVTESSIKLSLFLQLDQFLFQLSKMQNIMFELLFYSVNFWQSNWLFNTTFHWKFWPPEFLCKAMLLSQNLKTAFLMCVLKLSLWDWKCSEDCLCVVNHPAALQKSSKLNSGKLIKRNNFVRLDFLRLLFDNCSVFRNKSNGIFVLGVGFFSSDKFWLFN